MLSTAADEFERTEDGRRRQPKQQLGSTLARMLEVLSKD